MEYGEIAVKLVTGFFGLWIMTRLLGKKEISQLTPFDFVSSLVLSELIGNTIYQQEVKLKDLLFALAVWTALSYTFELITYKVKWLRRPLDGSPSILIRNGEIHPEEMKKNKIDFDQLRTMLRQQEVFSIREVAFAVFETDGSLSILKKSDYETVQRGDLMLPQQKAEMPYGLVEDGVIQYANPKKIGKDEDWLVKQLAQKGASRVKEVVYAEWMPGEGLYVMKKIG